VAAGLGADDPGFRYANLAVRGKLLRQVVDEQVPAAIALEPDLVSFAAGVNDALRRHWSLEPAAAMLEAAVKDLRGSGADVLLVAFGDPTRRSGAMQAVKDRISDYDRVVRRVADDYGCLLVDFWGLAVFDDDVFWSDDRLHLSSEGHARAGAAALEALGAGDDAWRSPIATTPRPSAAARAASTAAWTVNHLAPWLLRRIQGRSSGDGLSAKRPGWSPIGPQG
jgi:lysophospholipase L1-like esterase